MEGLSMNSLPAPQVLFTDISENDYLKILSDRSSGGNIRSIAFFKENEYTDLFRKTNRAGAGIFSFLSTLAKKSFPYLKNFIVPEAFNFGTSLVEKASTKRKRGDQINRSDIKSLAKKSLKNIVRKVIDKSSTIEEDGSGGRPRRRYRRKKNKKRPPAKRKRQVKKRRRKSRPKKKVLKTRAKKNTKKSRRRKKQQYSVFNDL